MNLNILYCPLYIMTDYELFPWRGRNFNLYMKCVCERESGVCVREKESDRCVCVTLLGCN